MSPLRLSALVALLLLFGLAPAKAQNAPSTIPLTLNESNWGGGRIFVTARFGTIQGPMRLDTGASTTRVMLQPWNKDWPAARPQHIDRQLGTRHFLRRCGGAKRRAAGDSGQ